MSKYTFLSSSNNFKAQKKSYSCEFNVHCSVQLGNGYLRLKVQRDAHGFLCIIYLNIFALHVSGVICTHHQEHKLQSKAVGTCDLWMAKVLDSMKRFRFM
jgi:hypothetical protein